MDKENICLGYHQWIRKIYAADTTMDQENICLGYHQWTRKIYDSDTTNG